MNSKPTWIFYSAVLLTFVLQVQPVPAYAQSIDSCMNASPTDAIVNCDALIKAGSTDAAVYHKLASAYYNNGNRSAANNVISAGLRIHPNDENLTLLRGVTTNSSLEEIELEKAKQKNQSRVELGRLKLQCLTTDTREALAACRQYLQSSDDSRVREKLGVLISKFEVPAPKPEPIPRQQPDTQVAEIPIQPQPQQEEPTAPVVVEQPVAEDPAKIRFRALAAEIQTGLNQLGFNAGVVDGAPGAKTRSALADFYAATNLPARTTIDDFTIEDINTQANRLRKATQLLADSKNLQRTGDLQAALNTLSVAEAESNLVDIPAAYRRELEVALNNQQIAERESSEPEQQAENLPTPEPKLEPPVTPRQEQQAERTPAQPVEEINPAPNDQELQQLLTQIRVSQLTLAKHKKDKADQLSAIRNAISKSQ